MTSSFRWIAFSVATVASCSTFEHRATPEDRFAAVASAIRNEAGPESKECGFVTLGHDGAAELACAQAADAAGSPFHVAVQLRGVDSSIWSLVVLKTSRVRELLLWDSNPTGGAGLRPGVSSRACVRFEFAPGIPDPVSCIAEAAR